MLNPLAEKTLAELKSELPDKPTASQRDSAALKLIRFRDAWKGTPAATEATTLLGHLGEQEVAAFQATWPAEPTPQQKKLIADQLRFLQSKWASTSAANTSRGCSRT